MTLKQWVSLTGVHPTHPTTETGAVSIIADPRVPRYGDLWQLSDYYVSSQTGGVLWLCPRLYRVRLQWNDGAPVTLTDSITLDQLEERLSRNHRTLWPDEITLKRV